MQRLRIWFDVLTPKQVMFFRRAVSILQEKGHEVLCTSRDYREPVELARMKGLDLKIVGRHGGPERYGKLVASAERIRALADVIDGFSPDVAVTFSSPEGARVAFGLGIKHVGFNDSPHATAVARLTVPLMNRLLCPWVIPVSAWAGFGISARNITRYRALDPAAWLKDLEPALVFRYSGKVLVRLEESKASYLADGKFSSAALVDSVVNELSQTADVTVLCRYSDQIEETKKRYGDKATVLEGVFDGVKLLQETGLFIGAGGTMSAEAALLGVPTISIAPVRYHVEDYLVRTGLIARTRDPKTLLRLVRNMLGNEKFARAHCNRAARILESMEDPVKKMVAAIQDHKL
jgi:predicted glycosyltransferase